MSIDRFQAGESRTSKAPADRAGAASGSRLPYALAALLVLAGVALALLPTIAPQHGWMVRSAGKYGLTSAPLLLAGCVLAGVALSLRGGRRETEPQSDDRELLLDQVASELAALRGGIQELRVEFVYVKDAQQSLVEALSERNEPNHAEAQQSAMFRLAASLDQVGARIEQRLAASESAMQGLIGELGAGIAATQERLSEIASAPAAAASAGDVWQTIDAGAPSSSPERSIAWQGPAPSEDAGLGLLDTLDDHGRSPSGPSPAQQRSPGDAVPSPHGRILHHEPRRTPPEPAAPLPQTTTAEGEAPLEGKIALLRSLLADTRVRQALETMRRG